MTTFSYPLNYNRSKEHQSVFIDGEELNGIFYA